MTDTNYNDALHPSEGYGQRPAGSRAALLALALATLLSGCAGYSRDHFIVGGTPPDDHRQRHPILIQEKEKTLDIPVSRTSYDLPVASQAAIEAIANQYRKSASGAMTVMVPASAPNSRAARKVADGIVHTLRKSGVAAGSIHVMSYDATRHGDTPPVRLSYHAIGASVKGCGQWQEDLAVENSENRQWRNFGCSSQSNLASMIANPSDLLAPRGRSAVDAQRRATVIDQYRQTGNPEIGL